MGCDIHIRVEVRHDGGWKMVGPIFESYWREGGKTHEPWEGRNYDLFAMLANVRNGRGFASVPTGLGFVPISPPRGIPDKMSPDGEEFMNSYGPDGHSRSYLTLRELREYDWDGQETMLCGVVPAEDFEKLRRTGQTPEDWSGGVSGPGIVTFSEEGYDRWVAEGRPDPGLDTDDQLVTRMARGYGVDTIGVIERPTRPGKTIRPYVRMTWPVTYREAAGGAWFETMDRLAELIPEGGTDEDVRIIFFFDN